MCSASETAEGGGCSFHEGLGQAIRCWKMETVRSVINSLDAPGHFERTTLWPGSTTSPLRGRPRSPKRHVGRLANFIKQEARPT